MNSTRGPEFVQTIVVGGGQAGLSVGYHLAKRGLPFLILDANSRIGDAWRRRWDSLRLFTPARYNGLAGMPFPAEPYSFPTKNEMADYLEEYARHYGLPVRRGVEVEKLTRQGDRFLLEAGDLTFEADNVVVAMSNWQKPRIPSFAGELDSRVVQLHSSEYHNLSQLEPGSVLVVGAGNSGAEVSVDSIEEHRTFLSGDHTGHIPFRIEGFFARLFLIRLVIGFLFYRVLTVRTPMGRKARHKLLSHGMPLIRLKPKDLAAAGIGRVPRVTGVKDGQPQLADGRVLDVANVIWCTGYDPGFSWIDLPVFGPEGPIHRRGVVENEPGLYFVGCTSSMQPRQP